ncbi:MAG: putative porin [Prolixibacteraceae bacterium]
MLRKYFPIVTIALLIGFQAHAQLNQGGSRMNRQSGSQMNRSTDGEGDEEGQQTTPQNKPKIPSVIKTWSIHNQGSFIKTSEVDTALWFFHNFMPFNQESISNISTGNNGGAYLSNDFFRRKYNSDFYFARSFNAYWLTPEQINYYNTTTPFSLLDYTQSENRSSKNETRFNVFHSQNVNKKLNFEFIFNQTRSQGQYMNQENKFHNIGIVTSYKSDKFLSHTNIIFNRLQDQENGGLDNVGSLGDEAKTQNFIFKMDNPSVNKIQNNNIYTINEYRVGKTIEADTAENKVKTFIPRVGFIHEFELSDNLRKFTKDNPNNFFEHAYFNSSFTSDSLKYTRITNIFQIKFYEAPDRKYTFGKRVYIGSDLLRYHMRTMSYIIPIKDPSNPEKYTNTFLGGGLFRKEGKFWQWEADGRIYLAGYRAGQTELNGYLNKPVRIGKDTTTLRVEGSLKTLIPEYFDRYYFSNHFMWQNNFDNINEMSIRSSIHSQEYRTTVGMNYALIGNYIYNGYDKMPTQAGSELLVLSAYLNKDFESKHWLVRNQFLGQKSSNENYLHLPAFAGFISINYRTVVSKVLYTQFGIDTRYNSAFFADAYEPGTSRFYLQDTQKIGNFPFIDLHANLKLKRTRLFFILMNAVSGLAGDNYYSAPEYPYYRRTFRLGVSWSFYD